MPMEPEVEGTTGYLPSSLPATTDGEHLESEKPAHPAELGSINETMQLLTQDSGYNSSESSVQQSPGDPLNDDLEDGELIHRRSRASSHTSISSIPASVLTNLPDSVKPLATHETHEYMIQSWENHDYNGHSRMEGYARQVNTIRQREATFRKPSSVRAMQMHTEDEGDDEYLTPPKRRGGQRISDISIRSAGSSPLKRSPFYSPTGIGKPKVKKEYPLVLLHCTLLPPSLPVAELVTNRDQQKILREILPPVYWKRWKLLEEKIGSGVLRDRGVLISHPEDMYDLLEERLLESLELQRPRLDHGHFLGNDETESDKESQLGREDSGTEDEGEKCLDCGSRVARQNMTKKWEVKVFAANGLMRAGAWAAAWKEMEKVDVEVGLWLPSEVRAELEKRLADERAFQFEKNLQVPLLQEPENHALGTVSRVQSLPTPKNEPVIQVPSQNPPVTKVHEPKSPSSLPPGPSEEIALQTLLINYIRVLASDRRNVAIALLSILMVFSALNSRSGASNIELRPLPQDILAYPSSSTLVQAQHVSEPMVDPTGSETSPTITSDITDILAPTPISESLSDSWDLSSSFTMAPHLIEPEESPFAESETSRIPVVSAEHKQPALLSSTEISDGDMIVLQVPVVEVVEEVEEVEDYEESPIVDEIYDL